MLITTPMKLPSFLFCFVLFEGRKFLAVIRYLQSRSQGASFRQLPYLTLQTAATTTAGHGLHG